MSFKDPKYLLKHILDSADNIVAFTAGMDETQYESDTKTQWAVERALLIIAEVAYRLRDEIDTLCPVCHSTASAT